MNFGNIEINIDIQNMNYVNTEINIDIHFNFSSQPWTNFTLVILYYTYAEANKTQKYLDKSYKFGAFGSLILLGASGHLRAHEL